MATLFDSASLVMIPSGYKDDKLYSIKPTDGSGDFTFSRDGAGASPATRVNASGLIEKGRENLLLQSNSFTTGWGLSNVTMTGGQAGYDGSNDAWLMTDTNSAGYGTINNLVTTGGITTFSCYAKSGTTDIFGLRPIGGSSPYVFFDLSNGTFEAAGDTANLIDWDIQDAGGGWYRCSVTTSATATQVLIYIATTGGALAPAGSTLYIQDAQLESGLVATDYIETTTAPVSAGLLGDMPRLDYSGGATCPSLLLEPSRVNLVTNSEYFSTATWFSSGAPAMTNNVTTSPEGVQNAAQLEFGGTSTLRYASELTFTNGYAYSIFVKKNNARYVTIAALFFTSSKTIGFDLDTGTCQEGGVIEPFGNDWYRLSVSESVAGDADKSGYFYLYSPNTLGGTTSGAGNLLYVYGAQIEEGSYPTSYIPTYGSASTRGADYTFTEDSILNVGTSDFTAFIDIDELNFSAPVSGESFTAIFGNRENGSTRWWRVWSRSTISALYLELQSDGGYRNYTIDNVPTSDTRKKICVVRTGTTIKAFINGVQKLNQSSAISGVLSTTNDKIELSSWNSGASANCFMSTNQVLYFNSALTDAECIALTTI